VYTVPIADSTHTIVFLSTYPPRECGIATFTQDLLKSTQNFLGSFVSCKVAALNVSPLDTYNYPSEVTWKIDQNNITDYIHLANTITTNDSITGVIIQHEYGIFGGEEGEALLSFMKNCKKPMLVTLHTVLPNPSSKMKQVTSQIIELASTVVVLTNNSKRIIEEVYPASVKKVFMVPHGIHQVTFSATPKYKMKLNLDHHILLSTFGLLSRGKGIEYVLEALPPVVKKYPSLLYLILGETHPVIRRSEGEKYRAELAERIKQLGLENHVKFYDQYFNLSDLFTFLKATDIYISTSTDPNQAVSGTLSYALGTGRAVISTQFAQAKEIVTHKTGRLVPIKDSYALTKAMLDLLKDRKELRHMNRNAYEITRPMLWDTVAREYVTLLQRIVVPPINIRHLKEMTDDFGLFQFASLHIPNKEFGYTLDDNARAMIVCSWLLKDATNTQLSKLLRIYLSFVQKCQLPDGSFINYLGFDDKKPTLQNTTENLQDAQARALWALSEIIANTKLSVEIRESAKEIFLAKLTLKTKFTHLRAKAFSIKAFALALPVLSENIFVKETLREYADSLLLAFSDHSVNSWRWFENDLSYSNALLSESLLIAGEILKREDYSKAGLDSLRFLISKTFSKTYLPIGHSKWYKNKEKRSTYDQQPEDPAAMILALVRAYTYTLDEEYKKLALTCFTWFLGNNSLKQILYDDTTGGCFDGLHPDRVNKNQGAESLISYLMSSFMIQKLQ